jgi:hypothetical protein
MSLELQRKLEKHARLFPVKYVSRKLVAYLWWLNPPAPPVVVTGGCEMEEVV